MSVTVVVSRGHRSGVGTLCLTSDQDLRWENVQRTETGNDSEETQTTHRTKQQSSNVDCCYNYSYDCGRLMKKSSLTSAGSVNSSLNRKKKLG